MASSETRIVYTKTLIIVSTVVIVFSIWLWWAVIHNSKQNIFNTMISNNLATSGVTRTVTQDNPSGTLTQLSQAQFGAQNVVQVSTTITQQQEDGETKVVTETIATPEENYARYTTIDVAGEDNPDFSAVTDVWGVQLGAEGGGSVFSEAAYGIFLFGNLPSDKRAELIHMIEEKEVYTPNIESVEATEVDGKSAYTYAVSVNTKAYVEVLKHYDAMLGLGLTESLDPEMYAQSPAIQIKVFVDKISRQLLKAEYPDSDRHESYSGYGITKQIDLPTNPISRSELENQLQELLQ